MEQKYILTGSLDDPDFSYFSITLTKKDETKIFQNPFAGECAILKYLVSSIPAMFSYISQQK